jgi:CIC family chloride channel protein
MTAQRRGPLRKVRAWRRLASQWYRAVEFELSRRFGLATSEDRRFFLLIPAVGVLAGVLGIAFHRVTDALRHLLWGEGTLLQAAGTAPPWRVIVALAVGGALVGLITWFGREPLGSGGGMSQLIEAVAVRGGRIPARPVVLRALAAVATVGSGGSLGREGPLIRLGAMISSSLGARLSLPTHRVKILVGCGAAAGLAAVYNIPIGGALFAMEVILGNFALEIFGPIVVSSVISTLITRAAEGDLPVYPMEAFALRSPWEILVFFGLGVLGAVSSVVFAVGVRGATGLFAAARLPAPLRPVVGFALLGAVALWLPFVLGSGHETILLMVRGSVPLKLLLILPLAKLVATALTAGSGGSGGLFTPGLFFGAAVGGAYGELVHRLWPELVSPAGAYAAVGMAAVAAGTSHAPISAILILAELTDNYDLLLPLMIVAITSSLLARKLLPHSIYTEPLVRRGVDVAWRMEEVALAGLSVGELARADPDTLRPADDFKQVVAKFLAARRQRLFVVSESGELLGAVSLHDIKHQLDDPGSLSFVFAHDLMIPTGTVLPDSERLHRAVQIFASSEYERLPVVSAASGKFVGVVGKRDLLAIYAQEVMGRPALLAKVVSSQDADASRDYIELPPDFAVRAVPLPVELAGRTLAEARLPQVLASRVIEIKRRTADGVEERIIPDAATRLERGDLLLLLGPTEALERLERGEMPVLHTEAVRGVE